jgi:hypothetical protein
MATVNVRYMVDDLDLSIEYRAGFALLFAFSARESSHRRVENGSRSHMTNPH